MIKSMTAYARGQHPVPPYDICVEVRSYNSRHLDVALKLTHGFEALEERIKAVVAETVARGRVEIRVQIQDVSEADTGFEINLPRARAYFDALTAVRDELGLGGTVELADLLSGGNMIQAKEVEKDADDAWPHVLACLNSAMADLDAMRRVEGDHLARDFHQRLDTVESLLDQIAVEAEGLPEIYQKRLTERIDALTRGVVEIDPARIAQEAALLADRSDISEEIVRAKSHAKQFRTRIEDKTPAGRPLNFLLQEFNREFTTMGAKSGKATMSHIIVAAKSELEKLREQVQNVE